MFFRAILRPLNPRIPEAVVLLATTGLAAVLVTAGMGGFAREKRLRTAAADFEELKRGITLFKLDLGRYPKLLDDLWTAPSGPSDAREWRGPYASERLQYGTDPLGHAYVYTRTEHGFYVLSSRGGDVTSWREAESRDVAQATRVWKLATALAVTAFVGQTILLRRRNKNK